MAQSIKVLIELGSYEQRLNSSKRLIKSLEKQIEDTQKKLEDASLELQTKRKEIEGMKLRLSELKLGLQSEEAQIAKLEAQVPLIKTQKEFNASKKQLEETRKRRGKMEEEFLQIEIKLEEESKKILEIEKTFSPVIAESQSKVVEFTKTKETHQEQLNSSKGLQATLLEQLDADVYKFFMRSHSSGLYPVICEVIDKACQGCNTTLPPQFLNELLTHPNIYRHCPHCTRILYYIPPTSA